MSQTPIYLDINNNQSVINALKAGEEKAFDTVYRYYFRRLCAFCSQYVDEQEEIYLGIEAAPRLVEGLSAAVHPVLRPRLLEKTVLTLT